MKCAKVTKFHRKSGREPRTALRSAIDREYTDFWVTEDHRWINGLAGTGVGSPNDDPYPIDNTWSWEARADVYYNLPWKFNVSSLFRATSGTNGHLTGSFSGTGTGQKLNQGGVTTTSYLTSTFGAVTGFMSPRVLRLGAVFSF